MLCHASTPKRESRGLKGEFEMSSIIALLIALQAPADLGATSDTSGAATGDRLICRQRPATGTRLRFTRTCLTQREWNERRENIARGIGDHVTREMASQPPPPITPGSD